jgi:exodeoxyribonuclease V beta subunit
MNGRPLKVFECELSGVSLIEASAGTGKTWNLCALYLRLLLQRGLEVRQILVVTFTKAATADLREQVRRRITETLASLNGDAASTENALVDTLLATLREDHGCDDAGMKSRLEQALQCFDEAAIFTIHGFCERALRDTPLGAGMPLSMEIVTDELPMARSIAADFWRRSVAAGVLPAGLAGFMVEQKDTPERFAQLLARRIAKPLANLRWPRDPDTGATPDMAALQGMFDAARECWQRDGTTIIGLVTEALPRLNANIHNQSSVDTAVSSWNQFLAGTDVLAAPQGLEKLDLFTGRRLVPKVRQAPPSDHAFYRLAQDLLDQVKRTEAVMLTCRARLLCELLASGPEALRIAKRVQRVMSFNDLLFNLYDRLTSKQYPWLAPLLRSRYPAALIDEFQDTDPLQFHIFKEIYIAAGLPLFLIGDPKQAIYSFRNADLRVYLQARRYATRIFTLADNQRCTEALLKGLNAIFGSRAQLFMVEGLDYVPLVCGLKPRAVFVDSTAARAALQLWSLPQASAGMLLAKPDARRCSARACAAEIARLLAAGQQGDITLGEKRLAASDIAVLVRTHKEGRLMREVLAAVAVGSVELSRASIFRSAEAQELERVLAAILEPMRSSGLRAAYATALLGGDAARIEALTADNEEGLRRINDLAQYRDEWLRAGVGVMLRRFINREKIGARLLALPFGERRLTNLLHLVEILHEADAHHATPEVLLRWLQARIVDEEQDEAAELRLESERHLVKIITIHRAKGLEYPIVFCPFLWDGHAGGADSKRYGREYHDENGDQVMDFRELSKEDAADVHTQVTDDRLAERVRLIYVALTRATHRCYITVGNYTTGRASTAEGCRGSLPWLIAGNGMTPAAWRANTLTAQQLDSAWADFGVAGAPNIGYSPLPLAPGVPLLAPRASPPSIAILEPPPNILPGWRLGSYSQLIHGASGERAAVDHDLRAVAGDAADLSVPDAVAAEDIVRFPRGMTAGHCIHAIFESVDFLRPDGWSSEINKALLAHPQIPRPGNTAAHLPIMLANMLKDVLHTPLPGGFRLAEVPRRRRLVELKFSLPASRVTHLALRKLLARHGHAMPALNFAELHGYLIGAVDLVIEAADRYWVLDWKSNFLGASAAHYETAALEGAMDRHHYHLQYLLYTAALHRYLQLRLPGYTYDRDFGGVLYLFVRGVRAGWIGRDGNAAGVYPVRPDKRLIEDLSALLVRAKEVA